MRILAVLSALHTANDGTVVLLPTLLPIAVVLFGIGYVKLGILVSAGYLANVVVQPLAGRYSDRIEPRKLLAFGIGIMGASAVVIAYAPNYSILLVGAVLLRLGSSFYHPIANSVVSKTTAGASVDRRMGVQSAFGDFGSLLIFSGGAVLYSLLGWKSPFLLFAAIDVVFSVFVYFSLGNINSRVEDQVFSDSEKVGATVISGESSERDLTPPIFSKFSPDKKKLVQYRLPISFYFVASFISAGAYAVTLNFANSLLSHEYGSILIADGLVSLWLMAFVLGDFFCGELSRKIERNGLILISYCASAFLYLIFFISADNQLLTAIVLGGNGFALSLSFPLLYAELGSRSYTNSSRYGLTTGTMFGLLFTSQVIGSATLAYLAGELSSNFGASSPFLVTGVMLFILSLTGGIIGITA